MRTTVLRPKFLTVKPTISQLPMSVSFQSFSVRSTSIAFYSILLVVLALRIGMITGIPSLSTGFEPKPKLMSVELEYSSLRSCRPVLLVQTSILSPSCMEVKSQGNHHPVRKRAMVIESDGFGAHAGKAESTQTRFKGKLPNHTPTMQILTVSYPPYRFIPLRGMIR